MKKQIHIFTYLFLSLFFALQGGYDVICVAAPSVDLNVHLPEEDALGGRGGSMIVGWDSFQTIVSNTPGEKIKISAGGSGANTVRAMGHLGNCAAIIGRIGSDPMKDVFLDALNKACVTPLLSYSPTPTQQVYCIITPDKQRTFRCYLGAMSEFSPADIDPGHFDGARLVHIEGYLVYNPGVVEITQEFARKKGALVSMDVGCYQIASSYKDKIFSMLGKSIDVLFANADEAFALTGLSPYEACHLLQSKCSIAVVLIGPEGCLVGSEGKVVHVPTRSVVVEDTVGAGDYFAAGFLHGLLMNLPLEKCAMVGNLTGSEIVQVGGTCLPEDKWKKIREEIAEISR